MKLKLVTLAIAFIIICNGVKAQSDLVSDSLLNEMCNTLIKYKEEPDSVRFSRAIRHLEPIFMKLDQAQQEKLFDYVYIRLQRNCKEFFEMLVKDEPSLGDWELLDEKPATKLNKKACSDFNSRTDYYYREADGDTVRVIIAKGFWEETFNDGTYSRLKFKWIGDCAFELEFIESNNRVKKNMSKKGEKYRYTLLEKIDNYYSTLAEPVGLERFSKFKMYY